MSPNSDRFRSRKWENLSQRSSDCLAFFSPQVTSLLSIADIVSLPRMWMAAVSIYMATKTIVAGVIRGILLAPEYDGLLRIVLYVNAILCLWGDKWLQLFGKSCLRGIKISFYFHGNRCNLELAWWTHLICIIQTWMEQSYFKHKVMALGVYSCTFNERYTVIYAVYIQHLGAIASCQGKSCFQKLWTYYQVEDLRCHCQETGDGYSSSFSF